MDVANLSSIVDELRQEETRLSRRRIEIQKGLDEIDLELNRVKAGLAALTGEAGSKHGKSKNSKPSPTKDAVRFALRECMSDSEYVDTESLKTAVGAKLVEQGLSRVGLSLRLKEVLSEGEFADLAGEARSMAT